jgi:peptide/nickel transport system substrate-binding protein
LPNSFESKKIYLWKAKMKKLLVALSILITILVIAGCTSQTTTVSPPSSTTTVTTSQTPQQTTTTAPSPTTTTPKYGGTLRVITDRPPTVLGWPPEIALGAVTVLQSCLEPLLHATSSGEIQPWLAESYQVADDLSSITFKLKKGVKFHDGSDFNAEAAKWNLDNQIQAKKQPYWKSVDQLDDYTIRVNLTQWQNSILSFFADEADSWMVSPTAFKKNGIDYMRNNPVGTGPFKFVSFASDTGFKTIKNPDYWGKDSQGNKLPYLEALEFIFVLDPNTQLSAMKTGLADTIGVEPGKRTADLAGIGLKISSSLNANQILYPDTANPDSPFSNQKVREAVEYAIDREGLAKAFGYGYWKAPYQIPAFDSSTYNPNFNLDRKYDLNKAKQLMAEAGLSSGFKITMVSSPAGRNNDANTALQSNLAAIGIQAEIQVPDQPTFSTIQTKPIKKALIFQGLSCASNLNTTIAQFFASTSPRFPSWARTPEFNKLVTASASSPKPDIKLMQACMDELTKECAVIPVYSGGQVWAYQPYVMDAGYGSRSQPVFYRLDKVWLNK